MSHDALRNKTLGLRLQNNCMPTVLKDLYKASFYMFSAEMSKHSTWQSHQGIKDVSNFLLWCPVSHPSTECDIEHGMAL